MPELRKIYKQGNSLVIAIPQAYAQQMQLAQGDYVSYAIDKNGALVMQPATRSGPAVISQGIEPENMKGKKK